MCWLQCRSAAFEPYLSGLAELTLDDFSLLPLADFGWYHLEGRNVENVAAMAELVRRTRVKSEVRISLEVEKLGRVYDDILPHVDVVFVSKEFSISKGDF